MIVFNQHFAQGKDFGQMMNMAFCLAIHWETCGTKMIVSIMKRTTQAGIVVQTSIT